MELICYLPDAGHPVEIRPARTRRRWMDDTPGAFAYRCFPLSMANAHGWEIRSIRTLCEEPELERQYLMASRKRHFRDTVNHIARANGAEAVDDIATRFQGWYTRGEMPDGAPGPEAHQKMTRARPFRDERG